MPLISKERFCNGTELGLWEITEDSATLEAMAVLSENEKTFLATFRNETRRCHWLSYRLIIGHLLGHGMAVVKYMGSGKPYIENMPGHISVTHSGKYSAVVFNEGFRVGIDIEQIRPRIENVAERFLSEKEINCIAPGARHEHLVSLWAAKEALFKMWGESAVEFKDDLFVEAFIPQPVHSALATISHNGNSGQFTLFFTRVEDYVMAWVAEQSKI